MSCVNFSQFPKHFRAMASRIATFEVREALWIREKAELEGKLKETMEAETTAKQRLHALQEQQKELSLEETIKKEHLVSLFLLNKSKLVSRQQWSVFCGGGSGVEGERISHFSHSHCTSPFGAVPGRKRLLSVSSSKLDVERP